jgi:rod shape-determining protein MreB and related proteins
MIVDIGGGTTEVAVISLGGIVASNSIRVAGDGMDQDIINAVRMNHNLLIGERTAESLKMEAGSAFPLREEREVQVKGRDLVTGLPRVVTMSTIEIRDALSPSVNAIIEAVRDTIERTPPELVTDIMERGIALAGGGAMLEGLDRRLSQETKCKVYVAEDPLLCVVRGTGEVLDELDRLKPVLAQLSVRRPPTSLGH